MASSLASHGKARNRFVTPCNSFTSIAIVSDLVPCFVTPCNSFTSIAIVSDLVPCPLCLSHSCRTPVALLSHSCLIPWRTPGSAGADPPLTRPNYILEFSLVECQTHRTPTKNFGARGLCVCFGARMGSRSFVFACACSAGACYRHGAGGQFVYGAWSTIIMASMLTWCSTGNGARRAKRGCASQYGVCGESQIGRGGRTCRLWLRCSSKGRCVRRRRFLRDLVGRRWRGMCCRDRTTSDDLRRQ